MTTTCRFDQLVWFRSDARARWWPAIYYESHLAAASDLAKINLAGIDESQQIALIYQYLQEQGGDSPPQPIVQLITGQPPATRTKGSFKFAHVTDPSTQLQRDFLQQLVQISQEPYATTDEEFRNALNEVRALIQTLRQSTVKVPSTTPTIVKEQNKPRVNVRFNTNTSITTNHSSIQATDHDHDIAMTREDPIAEENDDEEEESVSIEDNDTWDMVLFKLQSAGWYPRTVDGSTDILYVKPGRGIAHPFQENIDYFRGPDRLKEYVKNQFLHWKGGDPSRAPARTNHRRVTMSTAKPSTTTIATTPTHQTTKPQDPGIPLSLSSDGAASVMSWSSIDTDVLGSFGATFDILKQRGWKAVRAKNPLQDWWYIRPGRSLAGGTPGIDYFTSEEDVIRYIQEQRRQEQISKQQQQQSKHSPEIDAIQHVAVQGGQSDVTKKRKLKKNGRESLPRKRILLPTNKDSEPSPPALALPVTKNKKASSAKPSRSKSQHSEHWWKYENVPSFQNEIWPLLERLGFEHSIEGYRLPKHMLFQGNPVVFPSATGLRKFLCAYGVPNDSLTDDHSKKFVFNAKETERLRRWISFANVPVHSYNSIEKLSNIAAPKKEETILGWLYEFGFSTADNRIYVPEYTRMGPDSRSKPTHGKHFYYDHELTTSIRKYVRDAWRLGIMHDDDREGEIPVDDKYTGILTKGTASQKQAEKYLCLRVWAAVTNQELTKFQKMPPPEFLQPFLRMSEQECDDPPSPAKSESESEVSSVSSASSRAESSANESTQCQRPVKVPAPAKKGAKTKTVNDVHFPCFTQEIWPILQSFGFVVKNGRYHHPSIGFLADASTIQKFVICKGVPGLDPAKHKQEHETLRLWASYAHVGAVPSRIPALLTQQLPSDVAIHKVLQKLGFHFFDGKIFPPDADSVSGARSKRVHKIHYYLNLEEIREYIRSREFFSLLDDDTYFTKRHGSASAVTADEVVEIRNWAARSSAPLPPFDLASVKPMRATADSCEGRLEKELSQMNRGNDSFITEDVLAPIDPSTGSFQEESEHYSQDSSQTNDHVDPNKSPWNGNKEPDSAIESIEGNGSIMKNVVREKIHVGHSSVFESLDKPSPANTAWKSTFDDVRIDDESTSSCVRTSSETNEEYEQLLLTQANIDDDDHSLASINQSFEVLPSTQQEEDVEFGSGCSFF